MKHRILRSISVLVVFIAASSHVASAQTTNSQPAITFNSFNGNYYLSRDAENHSLLTSEEVVLADFPSTGKFTGITRIIPQFYQGNSVKIKVLSVTNSSGQDIPYKESSNRDQNLAITIGDPEVTLLGSQTFRIKYQTRNVVNLGGDKNEFLLLVNGRGWSQGFGQVNAVVHIPRSFSANLTSDPTCYIGYQDKALNNCTVETKSTAEEIQITSKSSGLLANQSLIIKMVFKPATFINDPKAKGPKTIFVVGGAIVFLGIVMFMRSKKQK